MKPRKNRSAVCFERAPLQYTPTAIVRSDACSMSPAAPACNEESVKTWLKVFIFYNYTILVSPQICTNTWDYKSRKAYL